jgi:peptide/nickel transport system substrate-binding protein
MREASRKLTWFLAGAVLLLAACAPAPAPSISSSSSTGRPSGEPGRVKTIVLAVSNAVLVLPVAGSNTTSGGWQSVNELYAQGLVTSDRDVRRPVPRLASSVPSLENGSIEILADGRMKTTFPLRRDVTWHDGTPFSARDLLFTFELAKDPDVPQLNVEATSLMTTVEAPDDYTLVIWWKAPYYQADSIGLRAFWPLPRHLLEQPYRSLDPLGFTNLPYWTTEFVHLGPFRLAEFRAGSEIEFAAYDGYFLGRPKVDRLIVRVFNDEVALYSATLAGSVDILMDNSLGPDLGLDLKDAWDASGAGTVYLGTGTTRFLAPQFDPRVQEAAALLDPQVRRALLFAIDRPATSEVVQHGHREFVANSLLPPGDRMYDAVKAGFAQYAFDPARSRAFFGELGWNPSAEGSLVGPDGRPLSVRLWTTEGGDREIAILADYWKQVGVTVAEQYVIPGARVRDREYRSNYPGFETSAAGYGDSILNRVDSRQSAVPPNYSGTNRGHYINPRLDQLIDGYRQSIGVPDRERAARAISDFTADDLPVLPLYFNPTTPAVRKGIRALDDFNGGAEGAQLFGTFTRNAHEWDVE